MHENGPFLNIVRPGPGAVCFKNGCSVTWRLFGRLEAETGKQDMRRIKNSRAAIKLIRSRLVVEARGFALGDAAMRFATEIGNIFRTMRDRCVVCSVMVRTALLVFDMLSSRGRYGTDRYAAKWQREERESQQQAKP